MCSPSQFVCPQMVPIFPLTGTCGRVCIGVCVDVLEIDRQQLKGVCVCDCIKGKVTWYDVFIAVLFHVVLFLCCFSRKDPVHSNLSRLTLQPLN